MEGGIKLDGLTLVWGEAPTFAPRLLILIGAKCVRLPSSNTSSLHLSRGISSALSQRVLRCLRGLEAQKREMVAAATRKETLSPGNEPRRGEVRVKVSVSRRRWLRGVTQRFQSASGQKMSSVWGWMVIGRPNLLFALKIAAQSAMCINSLFQSVGPVGT